MLHAKSNKQRAKTNEQRAMCNYEISNRQKAWNNERNNV